MLIPLCIPISYIISPLNEICLLKQIHNNDIQYEFSQPTQVSYTKATYHFLQYVLIAGCQAFHRFCFLKQRQTYSQTVFWQVCKKTKKKRAMLTTSWVGWAVALTCYINHSAKHRKMADFDPSGSQNPELILMVDYISPLYLRNGWS